MEWSGAEWCDNKRWSGAKFGGAELSQTPPKDRIFGIRAKWATSQRELLSSNRMWKEGHRYKEKLA